MDKAGASACVCDWRTTSRRSPAIHDWYQIGRGRVRRCGVLAQF
jgi:hypothetical protein